MDLCELPFYASLFQVMGQIIFFVSSLFPISVSMSSSLLDILWERKKIHRIFNEFSIDRCFFLQEMPACATDDAYVPK